MIRVFEPTVTYRDIFRVAVNMRSTYISGTSPVIKEFEEKFSNICSRKYGVAVSNGSVALDLYIEHQEAGYGKSDFSSILNQVRRE